MTTVSIVPVAFDQGSVTYQATAGDKHSVGKTAGEALDALRAQLSDESVGAVVVIQGFHPDRFFNEAQQLRMTELMNRWRAARDNGTNLLGEEQAELNALVESECRASGERANIII